MRFETGNWSRNVIHRRALLWSITALVTVLMTPCAAADTSSPLQTSGHLDLESMGNLTGAGSESSALAQLGGSFDTGAARWWSGGLLEFSLEGVRSAGTQDAGTGVLQIPNNEWASSFLRLYQLTYKQDFGSASVRAGIMDSNQYFESSELASVLHNASFGMSPNFTSNVDAPTFPNPGLGAMGEARFGGGWQARVGMWQADPPGLSHAFSRGALTIGELEHDWGAFGDADPAQDLKVGVWRDSQADPDDPGRRSSGTYLVGETRWQVATRQWGAFVLGGTTPGQVNVVTEFAAAGIVVTGLLTARPQDQFALAATRVDLAAAQPETVWEVVYVWQLNSSVSLQPDVQRFYNPAGGNTSAWVAGMRAHMSF